MFAGVTRRFYESGRGDVILNPLDKRCPYWRPSEELRRSSEADALAVSLFQPPQDKKGEFFVEIPQQIFAHLLRYGPSPKELRQTEELALAQRRQHPALNNLYPNLHLGLVPWAIGSREGRIPTP